MNANESNSQSDSEETDSADKDDDYEMPADTDESFSVQQLASLERRFRRVSDAESRGLTLDEFRLLMRRVMRGRLSERRVSETFEKIDAECRGTVDWDGFVSYLVCSYVEHDRVLKERVVRPLADAPQFAPDVSRYIPLHDSIVQLGYQPTTVKSDHNLFRQLSADRNGKYVSATSEGVVSFWTMQLLHVKTFRIEPPPERSTSVWVIDMLCMYNVNMLAVATTAPSVLFYDIAAFGFKLALTIDGLKTCATCLDYWVDPAHLNHAVLVWGDLQGSLHGLEFADCPTMCILQPTLTKLGHVYQSRYHFDEIARGDVCGVSAYRLARVHQFMVLRVRYMADMAMVMSCCRAGNTAMFLGDLRGERATYFPVARGIFAFDYCSALQLIIGGGKDTLLRVWNPQKPCAPVMFFTQHQTAILYVIAHRLREQVISISYDKIVNVFDLNTQQCLQTVVRKWTSLGPRPLSAIFFNTARDALLVATNQLALFEKSEEDMRIAQLVTTPNPIETLLYNDYFDLVVSTGYNGLVHVWSVTLGELLLQFDATAASSAASRRSEQRVSSAVTVVITAMVFDLTQRRLATGSSNGAVRMWNFNTGSVLREVAQSSTQLTDEGCEICQIHWPLHKLMVSSIGGDFRIYLDSAQGGMKMNWLYNRYKNTSVTAVAFYPPALIASASNDGNIIIWNCDSHTTVARFNATLSAEKRQQLAKRWAELRHTLQKLTAFNRHSRRRPANGSAGASEQKLLNVPNQTGKKRQGHKKGELATPMRLERQVRLAEDRSSLRHKKGQPDGVHGGGQRRVSASNFEIKSILTGLEKTASHKGHADRRNVLPPSRMPSTLRTRPDDDSSRVAAPNITLSVCEAAPHGSSDEQSFGRMDNLHPVGGGGSRFVSAVGSPRMPVLSHSSSSSRDTSLCSSLHLLTPRKKQPTYGGLLDKMDTLQPTHSHPTFGLDGQQSTDQLIKPSPTYAPNAKGPAMTHRVSKNVTAEDNDESVQTPEFERMSTQNRIVVDQILFLESRPFIRQVATLVAVGRCGWLHFWCIYGGHGMLHGQFSGARELDEWVGAVCTDKENAYLVTGDSHGYVRVWDIATYCMGRSVMERTQADALEAANGDKFYFLKQPKLVEKELNILRKHILPGANQELAGTCRYPPILNCYRAHLRPVTCLRYVDGRDYVLSSSTDASIRLWSVYGQFLGVYGKDTPWLGVLPPLSAAEQTPSRLVRRQLEVSDALHMPANYTIPDDIRGVASATTLKVLFRGLRVHWRLAKRLLLIWLPMLGGFKAESPTVEQLMSEHEAERDAFADNAAAAAAALRGEWPAGMKRTDLLGKSFKSSRKHQKLPALQAVEMRYQQCCVYGSLPVQPLAPLNHKAITPFTRKLEQQRRARDKWLCRTETSIGDETAFNGLPPTRKGSMCLRYMARAKDTVKHRQLLTSPRRI